MIALRVRVYARARVRDDDLQNTWDIGTSGRIGVDHKGKVKRGVIEGDEGLLRVMRAVDKGGFSKCIRALLRVMRGQARQARAYTYVRTGVRACAAYTRAYPPHHPHHPQQGIKNQAAEAVEGLTRVMRAVDIRGSCPGLGRSSNSNPAIAIVLDLSESFHRSGNMYPAQSTQ